jgi:hypothetical protein
MQISFLIQSRNNWSQNDEKRRKIAVKGKDVICRLGRLKRRTNRAYARIYQVTLCPPLPFQDYKIKRSDPDGQK